MNKKLLGITALSMSLSLAPAQITPSMSIPNPIPNYDGSYDDFSQAHLFYPNAGEVRYADEEQTDAAEEVLFYTMNTNPKQYLLENNNISLCYAHAFLNQGKPEVDSLRRIDLEWTGSNTSAFLARVDTQNFAVLNYFTPVFGSGGRTNVKGGAAIACQSIYNNIDLVYTSNTAGLVMYFIVYPGGNFNSIRLHVAGSKANGLPGGKLYIDGGWESTSFEKPQMYQYVQTGNTISPLVVGNPSWQWVGGDTYKISDASSYNTQLPIIIQIKQGSPQTPALNGLLWSTYFGGWQFEWLNRAHHDANDNLYVAGYSNSGNFPQALGVSFNQNNLNGDGAISKFNAAGQLQWSAFVGGTSTDEIRDFDFTGSSIYCVGKTGSSDLPTNPKTGALNDGSLGGYSDGFIFEVQLNAQGIIQSNWLTYYGGNGDEELNACRFDGAGNFFVVGESASTDLSPSGPGGSYQQGFNAAQLGAPNTPLSTDAIIAKFNGSSAQTWFTFFGTDVLGANGHNHAGDYFYGLAVSGNDVYACGKAGGSNLPGVINSKQVSNNFDGILAHFSTSGALNSSKYTNGNISNYAVQERWGKVYTAGEGNSAMTTVNSGQYYMDGSVGGSGDGCFSVHSSNLATTYHNSFLGGSGVDAAYDIQFSANNLLLIAGGTESSDFPVYNYGGLYNSAGGPDPNNIWTKDNFVTCQQIGNPNMIWSSYLGSNDFHESLGFPSLINSQQQLGITSIAVNSQNYLHLTGYSNSNNTFPLDNGNGLPYFQSQKSGGYNDGTVTRFNLSALSSVVGLKENAMSTVDYTLYPNPTTGKLMLSGPGLGSSSLSYAVYDVQGRQLLSGVLRSSDAKHLDAGSLPQGIYVLRLDGQYGSASIKFVKQN